MATTTSAEKQHEQCHCCGGTGVQYNHLTGLRVRCPCCYGSGVWEPGYIVEIAGTDWDRAEKR